MVERTIRSVAKELAGTFYTQAGGDLFGIAQSDRERSKRFFETYPTLEHYMKGIQVRTDGSLKQDLPGWMYFVDLARKRLVHMLGDPQHKHLHDAIYKALCEDNLKSTSPQAKEVLQRRINGHVSVA